MNMFNYTIVHLCGTDHPVNMANNNTTSTVCNKLRILRLPSGITRVGQPQMGSNGVILTTRDLHGYDDVCPHGLCAERLPNAPKVWLCSRATWKSPNKK